MNAQGSGDVIKFHVRSGVIGAVLALLVGGTVVTILVTIFPDSAIVAAVARAFAGNVCGSCEQRLFDARTEMKCCRVLLRVNGIDEEQCHGE